ncbi:nuclear transport factor 2 family protein [Kribbella sp. NBC_00709]|uniref:YybH family protein n=1 Tax=Kribbella sp. NBC_00709 TaxID=2975972 RepID=UPI002E2D1FC2|nr:nuclear transport factor 2 family protein [Kribbella sp. NBC_00709]
MTTNNAVAEVDIRERIESLLEAVRTGDLDTLKTIFAPNIVSFDIQPPLRHLGAETKWANWQQVFAAFQLPLEYEARDLTVLVDGDLAVVYSLNHMNATMNPALSPGGKIDYWLRWTAAWQKIDGQWMIVHDQVSVPTNFLEGTAAMDLMP